MDLLHIQRKLGDNIVIMSDDHWRIMLSKFTTLEINKLIDDGKFVMPFDIKSHTLVKKTVWYKIKKYIKKSMKEKGWLNHLYYVTLMRR